MPAMPPTTAAPVLRTFRRVTVVMRSSSGDAIQPIYAGPESPSAYRASVRQRMRVGFACATRCFDNHLLVLPMTYGEANGGMRRVGASRPAREPYRHNG